ncbi:MAG TPA: 16S rRNA (guanine(966)-N(2))-methyltransferase RsmD [Candidatus Saccharibacteria bacterium]|nr:16S rRNA (guanine(966)-N(2))-methyltransferase RsmD [Candidatus Saccharibacteria bacterium]
MRIRLIAGEFGGRFLDAPDTSRTHPMGERMRSALFNMLGDVSNFKVLDAFAGTGALGLEALSRGAAHTTFVERDRIAQKVITKNIESLRVADRATLVKAPVASWTETAGELSYDLILVDPPYHDLQLSTVSRLVDYLQPKGLMILSHPGRESAPTVNGVVVVDNRSYGDAALAFYRLVE